MLVEMHNFTSSIIDSIHIFTNTQHIASSSVGFHCVFVTVYVYSIVCLVCVFTIVCLVCVCPGWAIKMLGCKDVRGERRCWKTASIQLTQANTHFLTCDMTRTFCDI